MFDGKIEKRQQRVAVLEQAVAALSYLGAYFSAKFVMAASAAARFGDSQISCRDRRHDALACLRTSRPWI
jgi:hypothetical protein